MIWNKDRDGKNSAIKVSTKVNTSITNSMDMEFWRLNNIFTKVYSNAVNQMVMVSRGLTIMNI